MTRATLVQQRLLVLFLIGLLLLFSPLTLRFDMLGHWLGIPLLTLYLFAAWALIIAIAAAILARSRS